MFQYVEDVGRTNLRSASDNKLYIPRTHHKTIRSSGPRMWNSLKKEVREAETVRIFKRLYHKNLEGSQSHSPGHSDN